MYNNYNNILQQWYVYLMMTVWLRYFRNFALVYKIMTSVWVSHLFSAAKMRKLETLGIAHFNEFRNMPLNDKNRDLSNLMNDWINKVNDSSRFNALCQTLVVTVILWYKSARPRKGRDNIVGITVPDETR